MAGKVQNIRVCGPLKLLSGVTGKVPRNLPLLIQLTVRANSKQLLNTILDTDINYNFLHNS